MEQKQNIRDIDWDLVGKYLTGEANSNEKQLVENWAGQSESNQKELLELQQLVKGSEEYYLSRKFNPGPAWNKISQNIKTEQFNKPILYFNKIAKYAAIFIVAITMGFAGYYLINNVPQAGIMELATAEKQVSELVLPDGTLVTLNSNSRLEYPKEISQTMREVTISGEAFFDVKPNAEKPFVIHAGNTQVKVLGTSFNVCAYPEKDNVEVTVETGKVQVNRESENQIETGNEIILLPGEKATVYKNAKRSEKLKVTDRNFLAWKTQNLVFKETPLTEVVEYLENVYHVDIQISGNDIQNLPLTATFNKKPVGFVLDVIRLTFNLKIETEGDLYIISRPDDKNVKL